MAQNECDDEVPAEVAELACQRECSGGVRYVYRDGRYCKGRPVASIGGARGARFRSDDFRYYKVPLADGWVAFRSPTRRDRAGAAVGAEGPSRPERVNEITVTRDIAGMPLVYRVEDEVVVESTNEGKLFYLQKLRHFDRTAECFESGAVEYRLCYYMIAHKPRMKGKWAFGQFAPMMTPAELQAVFEAARQKGWL